MEVRELWALPTRPDEMSFCAAEQVIRIRRCFTEVKTGRQTEETLLAISSIRPLDDTSANARMLQDVVRGQ